MEFKTNATCRGCRNEFNVFFDKGLHWVEHTQRVQCPKCDSDLELQCRRDMFGMEKRVQTRTKMIKHTEKLLEMLQRPVF